MIPEEIRLPLIELVDRAEEIPNLECIILFGSAIRGELNRKSDIDLLMLFNTDHNPEIGEEMNTALRISSDISQRYDLPYSFSFIMINSNKMDEIDPDFLWNIAEDGIILWGKPDLVLLNKPHSNLEAMIFIKYSLKECSSREKGAIKRALFGFRVKKIVGDKVYVNQKSGLIEDSYHIGAGALLVPARLANRVIDVLKRNKARYSLIKLWR